MRKLSSLPLPMLAVTTLALASGCGGGTIDITDNDAIGTQNATLRRAQDCNTLIADLRADEIAKVNRYIDGILTALRECKATHGADSEYCTAGYAYNGGGRGGVSTNEDSGFDSDDAPLSPGGSNGGAAPPRAGGDESTSGGEGGRDPNFSDTNTQVKGVDEADIVKTDGKHLYLIHGNTFRVVKAWPATELDEISAIDLEGVPSELYVDNGLAVIFATVDGRKVYEASGTQPRNDGYGYGSSDDVGIGGSPGGDYDGGGYSYQPLTKITVLRIGADKALSVAKETYFEGNYLSSRRVGSQVRTVLQNHTTDEYMRAISNAAPEVEGNNVDLEALLERVRTDAIAALGQLPLDRFLPRRFDAAGGSITATTLACENAYTPTAGTTQSGFTQLSTLDLENLDRPTQETGVFGNSSTVYSNAGALYLASEAWIEQPIGFGPIAGVNDVDGGDTDTVGSGSSSGWAGGDDDLPPVDPSAPDIDGGAAPKPQSVGLQESPVVESEVPAQFALNRTHLHKFSFDAGGAPVYIGSGSVDGRVHNQFSLDERAGVLRVATTEERGYASDRTGNWSNQERSFTHVHTLRTENGALVKTGSVNDLAPGERIYSVRYVGDRGYVVTFRQVDPLFVIDLANPATPSVLGELKIPGFSEYMHPLDDNHLLTIGREATDEGQVQGLALQIFDVTNPTQPRLDHKYVYNAESWGYSEASSNHKAFTYFADRGVLAFPYAGYDNQSGQFRSTLELFRVGAAEGFNRLGAIDHSGFASTEPMEENGCYYYKDVTVRRGLFIENFAYSISQGGIIVKSLENLAAAGSSLELPHTALSGYCNGSEGGRPPSGGVAPGDGDTGGEPDPLPEP